MSFVIVTPEVLNAAAADAATIGSAIRASNAAAARTTTALAAAGADEVSAAIAALFSDHAQQYQVVNAQVEQLHQRFVAALTNATISYATAEAANASPLQTLQQNILAVINAPTQTLLGRPLIGNGVDGTAANPNGQDGGLLYGNGGNGYSYTSGGGSKAGG
ncbi:PE family protein, partial [Mycobacterium riyadhense]